MKCENKKLKKCLTGNANLWYSIKVVPGKVKQIINTEHWQINSNATLKILFEKRTKGS